MALSGSLSDADGVWPPQITALPARCRSEQTSAYTQVQTPLPSFIEVIAMRSSLILGTAVLVLLPLGTLAPFANQPDTPLVARNRPSHRVLATQPLEGRLIKLKALPYRSAGDDEPLGEQKGHRPKQNPKPGTWQISVDFTDGHRGTYIDQGAEDMRIGDRVRLHNGQISRF